MIWGKLFFYGKEFMQQLGNSESRIQFFRERVGQNQQGLKVLVMLVEVEGQVLFYSLENQSARQRNKWIFEIRR